MSTVVKLGLGIFLGGTLLVVACAALIAGSPEFEETTDGGTEATDAGDGYCSAEKEDEIAALELGSPSTVNSPAKVRRGTKRLLRLASDAPRGAWCVDQEVTFLIDLWNSSRGDPGYEDAAEQVNRLRRFERR